MDRKISILEGLVDFIHLDPELPDVGNKSFEGPGAIELKPGMAREEIIQYLESRRASHRIADLAFHASRDLAVVDWSPFLKAALERNPVVIEACKDWSDDEVFQTLEALPNESIYDGTRVAQPDEVWNFQRGDGLERAIAFSNVWKSRHPESTIHLDARGSEVVLTCGETSYRFPSTKGLEKQRAL
jgi:hypothetical protein